MGQIRDHFGVIFGGRFWGLPGGLHSIHSSLWAPTFKAFQNYQMSMATTTQAQQQVDRRLLLNVVVGQRAAILELLAATDQTLVICVDALLILDLGLQVVNGVASLDIKVDGIACHSLDEDLHAFSLLALGMLRHASSVEV